MAAVIDYLYWHVRATEGKGKKVWEKMQAFLEIDQAKSFAPEAVAAEQENLRFE